MKKDIFKGRNGIDGLSVVLSFIALPFLIFDRTWLIGSIIFGYAIFRAFSKNIYQRRRELEKYHSYLYLVYPRINKFLAIFKKNKSSIKEQYQNRRIYKYYKCPSCKKELRVPKNKGTIDITCPKCKKKFRKKT